MYSLKQIQKIFSPQTIKWAHTQIKSNPVQAHIQREGALITGLVPKPDGKPYRVYIRIIAQADQQTQIKGECSCDEDQCGHVVMLLLAGLEQNTLIDDPVASTNAAPSTPVKQTVHLLYILQTWPDQLKKILNPQPIEIQLLTARKLDSGEYGRTAEYQPSASQLRNPPTFLSTADLSILQQIVASNSQIQPSTMPLSAAQAPLLLRQILETKRAFYHAPDHPKPGFVLSLSEPRNATAQWQYTHNGDQTLALECTPRGLIHLFTDCAWYLDTDKSQCGPLTLPYPIKVISDLLAHGDIAPEHINENQHSFQQAYPSLVLPSLRALKLIQLPVTKPEPILFLSQENKLPEHQANPTRYHAQLRFNYAGIHLEQNGQSRVLQDNQVFEIQRDTAFEQSCRAFLLSLGLNEAPLNSQQLHLPQEHNAHHRFLMLDLAELRLQNWAIEFDPSTSMSLCDADEWPVEMHADPDDPQWFHLSLGILVAGKRVNLLPILLELLTQLPDDLAQQNLLTMSDDMAINALMPDGQLLAIPVPRLRRILDNLLEFLGTQPLTKQGTLKLHRIHTAQTQALEEAPRWQGDTDLLQLANHLRQLKTLPFVAPPTDLRAQLRPYQQQGLNWLQFMRQHQFGSILADDMGLGKTLQTLAHILLEKQQARLNQPCLIIAPTSLLFNWRREAEQFAPSLRVLTLHGPQRHRQFKNLGQYDLILTSYALLSRDQNQLQQQHYHLLVLDEAQAIKNPLSQASRAARLLTTHQRLCLTGTPIENHLGELWSLFDFLMPQFLGKKQSFKHRFRDPIEKLGDARQSALLARRIRPFMLRRRKDHVVKELPPCSEILRHIELQDSQRELYESLRLPLQKQVRALIKQKGLARNHIMVLDALLKLRQVCCDPRLVKLNAAQNVQASAKLELLMRLLPEMLEEGRRILVFSQFTSMLSLIADSLEQAGLAYTTLTGQTRDREAAVQRFQNGDVPIFLISLKAGGTGLNLTAADTVIHYDPWWNPAAERQATGRAHRIGQTKPVFVYKLITANTVEERIHAMQQRKQQLADALYSGSGKTTAQWSEDEIEHLFQSFDPNDIPKQTQNHI